MYIETCRPNNIFYGDVFSINGNGCLIFGHGKTKACRVAGDDIALDFACLTKDNDELYGHFEPPIRAEGVPDPIKDKIQISYLVRMLNEEETVGMPELKGEITTVAYRDFVMISWFNICVSDGMRAESDRVKRMDYFSDITQNTKIKECIIVPWKQTHEERGLLLKKFIK